jgi:UDP-N-acetylmuramate dehydrogenase
MRIEEGISLAQFTTFRIGGPARYFARAQDIKEVCAGLAFAKEKNLKTLILGGGSNVLISDAGFDGLVIKIEIRGIKKEDATVIVGAGESWDALVEFAINQNLWGIENLSGIPGTVGGAVAGNIGAYGQALSQTLLWAEVFDTDTGEIKHLSNTECRFGYRESIFTQAAGRYVILRAAFELSSAAKPELSYKDLKEVFGDGAEPSLEAIREQVLAIRARKFPDLAVEGTAGSFFKNPIVPEGEAKQLQERYPEMPIFPMPETSGYKIPLGWLLDHVLTMRGTAVGGARMYEKQVLVIAAARGTTASDVVTLANEISKKVLDTFAISLQPEVKIID